MAHAVAAPATSPRRLPGRYWRIQVRMGTNPTRPRAAFDVIPRPSRRFRRVRSCLLRPAAGLRPSSHAGRRGGSPRWGEAEPDGAAYRHAVGTPLRYQPPARRRAWVVAVAEGLVAIVAALVLPPLARGQGSTIGLSYDASTAQATLGAIAGGM